MPGRSGSKRDDVKGEPAIYCDYCGWIDTADRHLGTCSESGNPTGTAQNPLSGQRTLAEAICGGCGYPMHAPNDECWYVDLGTCAYYRGEGTCSYGCTTEPSCFTDRPREGWPCERAALSLAAASGLKVMVMYLPSLSPPG